MCTVCMMYVMYKLQSNIILFCSTVTGCTRVPRACGTCTHRVPCTYRIFYRLHVCTGIRALPTTVHEVLQTVQRYLVQFLYKQYSGTGFNFFYIKISNIHLHVVQVMTYYVRIVHVPYYVFIYVLYLGMTYDMWYCTCM